MRPGRDGSAGETMAFQAGKASIEPALAMDEPVLAIDEPALAMDEPALAMDERSCALDERAGVGGEPLKAPARSSRS